MTGLANAMSLSLTEPKCAEDGPEMLLQLPASYFEGCTAHNKFLSMHLARSLLLFEPKFKKT